MYNFQEKIQILHWKIRDNLLDIIRNENLWSNSAFYQILINPFYYYYFHKLYSRQLKNKKKIKIFYREFNDQINIIKELINKFNMIIPTILKSLITKGNRRKSQILLDIKKTKINNYKSLKKKYKKGKFSNGEKEKIKDNIKPKIEVLLSKRRINKRTDILWDNLCIEIQCSPITSKEVNKREFVYKKNKKRTIWIIGLNDNQNVAIPLSIFKVLPRKIRKKQTKLINSLRKINMNLFYKTTSGNQYIRAIRITKWQYNLLVNHHCSLIYYRDEFFFPLGIIPLFFPFNPINKNKKYKKKREYSSNNPFLKINSRIRNILRIIFTFSLENREKERTSEKVSKKVSKKFRKNYVVFFKKLSPDLFI